MLSLVTKSFGSLRLCSAARVISTSIPNPAARKGTREKAKKKKVKVEVKKIGFIPHNQREKNRLNVKRENKHIDDSWKGLPVDDCYFGRYYRWTVFSVADAIKCHKESNHPTMYNVPNAPLIARIEMNMQSEKKTKFVENFQRIAQTPHKFDHGEERTVLVFAKGQDIVAESEKAGATLAGGLELIKDIQNGRVQLADFQYYLAHPNILADLVALRGIMKRKFPNPKLGTLSSEITEMVQRFINGIQYKAVKDDYQPDFGCIETCVGTLNMDSQHLEENLVALLRDIDSIRPKRNGRFITRVLLKAPPSKEQLKIDPFLYVQENFTKTGRTHVETEEIDDDDEGDEPDRKLEAANS